MKFLQQVMGSPRNRWVFLLMFVACGLVHAQKYRIGWGPDSSSTNPQGCAAAGAKWFSTAEAACQGATSALPLCDRNTAVYRNYLAQLSGLTCTVQWEYQNIGSTGWGPYSGAYTVEVERAVDILQTTQRQPPNTCRMTAGNPIDPLNGSKIEVVDLGGSIGGKTLKLTYDSSRSFVAGKTGIPVKTLGDSAAFGPLWFSGFHKKLSIPGTVQGAKLFRGDGTVIQFRTLSGVFVAEGPESGKLVSTSGVYQYTDPITRTVETYNSNGLLTSEADSSGKLTTYSYSTGASAVAPAAGYLLKVVDSGGRSIQFEYVLPAGGKPAIDARVSRIVDATGQAIVVAYDAVGNLATLTWPDSKMRRFLYEHPTLATALTGIVDENNSQYAYFSYDDVGYAESTSYAGGVNLYTVQRVRRPEIVTTEVADTVNNVLYRLHAWQPPADVTLVGPTGSATQISSTSVQGMILPTGGSQPAGSGCNASTSAASYDALANPVYRDDFSGNRTCYVYDASNRETARVEGLATSVACSSVISGGAALPTGARKITTVWHPDWKMPTRIDAPGVRTTNIYQGQPDPLNGGSASNCTTAPNLPNGKPIPVVCKEISQATTDAAGGGGAASGDADFDKVTLLLHMDGANGAKTFVDSSSSPKTLTASGNAALSTAQNKFGGASAYFDGASSSYLSLPSATSIVSAGDITIEGWIYPVATTQGTIYSNFISSGTGHNLLYFINGQVQWYYNGNSWIASGLNSVPQNQWTHFALVRSGTTCSIYVNGVSTASVQCASAIGTTATDLRIGNAQWSNIPFKGYIDEFRISVGKARYAYNFTPMSAAFGGSIVDSGLSPRVATYTYDAGGRVLTTTDPNGRATGYSYYSDSVFTINAQSAYDADYDAVSLLLHGNGSNGSTSVADSGPGSRTLTLAGNAQISTAQSKFGGASLAFDGSGDYVRTASSTALDLAAGDYTVEAYIRISATPASGSYFAIVSNINDGTTQGWRAIIDSNRKLLPINAYWTGASLTQVTAPQQVIPLNTWVHIALTRNGSSFKTWINGTLDSEITGTGTINTSTASFDLGATIGSAWYFNGYIDEFRITKGKARYTANFTPPAAEFPGNGPLPSPNDVGHTVGDLQSVTNAAGHVTQYTQYDRAGRVRQMIDPKGVVTDITYTPRGWVSTVTATAPGGAGRTTSYTYDNVGQLTGVAQPDGTTLSYSYDAAHRLVGVTDAKGNSVSYTLDNAGNRIGEETKDSTGTLQRSISRSFDVLNRVQQVTGAAR